MAAHAREHPSAGIAKAFANILAPASGAELRVAPPQRRLQMLGRPSQLAPYPRPDFAPQHRLKSPSLRIPQAQPGEVIQLVRQYALQLPGLPLQRAIEHDLPPSQETPGV